MRLCRTRINMAMTSPGHRLDDKLDFALFEQVAAELPEPRLGNLIRDLLPFEFFFLQLRERRLFAVLADVADS